MSTNSRGIAAQRGFALPLIAKIFIAISLVVALSLAAAIAVTSIQGEKAAKTQVNKDLAQIVAAQKRFEEAGFDHIELLTDFVSSDPNVAQYFNTASGDDLGLSEVVATEGQRSVKDLLVERQEKLGFDLGIVTDPEGNVLARLEGQIDDGTEQNLKEDSFLGPVITSGEPASGYWTDKGQLYQAAASPIALGDSLVGFVLLANMIDADSAREIAEVSAAQVAFFVTNVDVLSLIASSLPKDSAPALESAVNAKNAAVMQAMGQQQSARVELIVDGKPWTGELQSVLGSGKRPLGAVLALSETESSESAFKEIQRAVNLTGLAALAIALLASWFLAHALLKPIRGLVGAAEKAAAGDYSKLADTGGNDEIGKLAHAFDSLLSNLREKGDMEGYVSNLSKFLPEPGSESVQAGRIFPHQQAQRMALSLVAVDFKRFAQEVSLGTEAITLTQLATLHADAEALARQHEGKVLEHQGARIVFGFGGEHRQLKAMHGLNQLIKRAAALGPGPAPAAAIHDGEVVHGSLPNFEPATATVGVGIAQLQRLLGESGSGLVLLGPAFAKSLSPILEKAPGTAVGSSGKKFYALTAADLASLPALPQAPQDPNATQISGNETRVATGSVNEGNAARLAPGMRLGGRYEIQSVLGAGGMGVVYKAHDLELDDVVALKMLRGAALMDAEHLDRLKTELKLSRKITNPNVLRNYDFGDINGQPFISMEYVRGMTLRFLLEQAGKLPYSAGLRIARQVTGGLQAAHAVGVLHRDIKPENVILEASGNAKLMDFGIARPIRRTAPGHTQPGMFVGTPNYSPPEALAGEDVDARGDIYSMGVMLYEIFCGALPFKANSTMEMYLAHAQQAPIRPSKLWPEIPKALEEIILTCLAKVPAQRLQSADALLHALAQLRA